MRIIPAPESLAEHLATVADDEVRQMIEGLSDEEALRLLYDWDSWARHNQRTPAGAWYVWLYLAGRGSGKTRTGAETVQEWVMASGTSPIRIALVGQTAADVRDVMVQGDSGILQHAPPWCRPTYEPSRRRMIWPNGSFALMFSGDSPDQLRGPQFHKAWVDELAKFQYAQETWDNLEFGLRLGANPQAIVTTTPRPIPIIKTLLEDDIATGGQTFVTRGSSYENLSNLAGAYVARVIRKYEGTRLGRQELHAEVLTDMPGALWNSDMIEQARVTRIPEMVRVVVAIDPAVTAHEESDETGIVVCGKDAIGNGYVLRDVSGRYSPDKWAEKAIEMYNEYGASRVVAEVNNGGDLVETILRSKDRNVAYKEVRASHGKIRRAEPVAALYERHLIKHHGSFPVLEDQMTTYAPDQIETQAERRKTHSLSPDRMDAMVWGMTELLLGRSGAFVV